MQKQLNGIADVVGDDVISAMKRFDGGQYSEKESQAIAGILKTTSKDVEEYVKDTTELTWLEKISNSASLMSEQILGYKGTMNLANAAFAMYLASGAVSLFKGLGNFISGWKNGGGLAAGLSKMLGGGASSTGLLASGGALATGLTYAAAVAAPIAITAGIGKLSDYFDKKAVSKEGDKYAMNNPQDELAQTNNLYKELKGTDAVNSKYGTGTFGQAWKTVGTGFAELWNTTAGRIGGAEHDNRNYLNIIRNNERQNAYFVGNQGQYLTELLYYILADKAGMLSQFGFTEEELKEVVKNEGWTPSFIIEQLKSNDDLWKYAPKTSGGYQLEKDTVLKDTAWFDRYLMNGLSYVPRDGFRALLHKGEMVLNAKEANAYRGLEKNVGGQSDSLYSKQQKIILGKTVSSKTDVGYAGKEMGLPSGWSLTSAYGTYTSRDVNNDGLIDRHRGLDFAAATGTPIRAAHGGTIYFSSSEGGYGNTIRIHDKATGFYNRYGHLSRFANIKNGATVNRGDLIGYVGNTGNSTGSHLHFQVNKTNNESDDINPWPYVTLDMFGGSGSLGLGDATSSASSSSGLVSAAASPSTRRFIPGANIARNSEKNVGGSDTGATRIVSSVDGGFNKLISYLESISKKQDEQQMLLDAFSKSRTSGPDF